MGRERSRGPRPPQEVAVVGAGVSGLATAYFLSTLSRAARNGRPPIRPVVLEAGSRTGGKLWTVEVGGVRVEAGADSFVVRKPEAVELCRELGLEDEVVIQGSFGSFVLVRGKLVRLPERSAFGVPADVRAVLGWRGLPPIARLRALGDVLIPAAGDERDRPLGALLRRRLGIRAAEVMVEPLLAGLHAGDPSRLSLRATFPELEAWERTHGSLILGARAAAKAGAVPGGGRKPLFASVWGGMARLPATLEDTLGPDALRLDTPVRGLSRAAGGWVVRTPEGERRAEAVVLATPAFESARLLKPVNPLAARELSGISYGSTAVVILVYDEETGSRLPEGTGFVVPGVAGVLAACTWVSRKWPLDEFGGRAVLRCFVGRAGREEALGLADDELVAATAREVEAVTPLGEPWDARVIRWPRSMPQYEVGHLERVGRIERELERTPGVFLTGAGYRGVGIPDCIRQAREVAERVLHHLEGREEDAPAAGAERSDERETMRWTT